MMADRQIEVEERAEVLKEEGRDEGRKEGRRFPLIWALVRSLSGRKQSTKVLWEGGGRGIEIYIKDAGRPGRRRR